MMPYFPSYEEDYRNGVITEAAYNYYKFIFDQTHCGNASYSPNVVTFHKALNHNPKMVRRLHEIRPGEGMQSAVDRLLAEGKEDLVKEVFPKKIYSSRNRR